jgi:hypothetical protein
MGWVLFIDESGDFDSEHDRVCVGGLLAPDEILQIDGKTWRQALGKIVWAPAWPPHATELNQPAGLLAMWLVSERQWRPRGVERSTLEAAERLIDEHPDPPAREFLRLARERHRMPGWETLVAVSPVLAREPAVFGGLNAGVARLGRSMAQLIGQLDEALRHRCSLVMAFESRPEHLEHARYLSVLEAAIERAVMLVATRSERHQLDLTVAARGVRLGPEEERQLSSGDLADASRGARVLPGSASVEVKSGIPVEFDANAPAGLVLADWLCNRARFASRQRSWPTLRDAVWKTTGASAERQVPLLQRSLPTFALAGSGRQVVAGHQSLEAAGLTGWRLEVTQRWRDAVSAGGPR